MSHARTTPLIQSLPATVPFVGPEVQERTGGLSFHARLGANESVFGPSPRAIEAMREAAADIWKYGDSASHDLRGALAALHGTHMDNIVMGEGIDGLLGYLVRLLIAPGDAVVTSDGAYPTFNYHVTGHGGILHKVPFKDDHEDLPALLARAGEVDAKLVYFSNPDNPMGSWWTGQDIAAALKKLPEGCLFILDEAYIEFAPDAALTPIPIDDPRVIRMRTFSKAYGMAGARVGYAMAAPALIAEFDKIRNHFGMNRAAQAGALAAVKDAGWLAHVQKSVADSRNALARIARDNGLTPLPSVTNFVAMDCGEDGAFARAVLAGLTRAGIFARMPGTPPLDRCIRVSCGRPEDLDRLAAALPRALREARKDTSD